MTSGNEPVRVHGESNVLRIAIDRREVELIADIIRQRPGAEISSHSTDTLHSGEVPEIGRKFQVRHRVQGAIDGDMLLVLTGWLIGRLTSGVEDLLVIPKPTVDR